jgi:hypothetical protein
MRGEILSYLTGKTTRRFGVLVIDEQVEKEPDLELTDKMLDVITFGKAIGAFFVLVEINPGLLNSTRKPTRLPLRAAMPADHQVFYKVGFNAFGVVDTTRKGKAIPASGGAAGPPTAYPNLSWLDALLRNAGVNELIVMGRQGGQCVKRTVVGGIETSNGVGPDLPGALHFGYQVWTTPDIVVARGTDYDWYATRGVKCYARA